MVIVFLRVHRVQSAVFKERFFTVMVCVLVNKFILCFLELKRLFLYLGAKISETWFTGTCKQEFSAISPSTLFSSQSQSRKCLPAFSGFSVIADLLQD